MYFPRALNPQHGPTFTVVNPDRVSSRVKFHNRNRDFSHSGLFQRRSQLFCPATGH